MFLSMQKFNLHYVKKMRCKFCYDLHKIVDFFFEAIFQVINHLLIVFLNLHFCALLLNSVILVSLRRSYGAINGDNCFYGKTIRFSRDVFTCMDEPRPRSESEEPSQSFRIPLSSQV